MPQLILRISAGHLCQLHNNIFLDIFIQLCLHFKLNYTTVKFRDCILHFKNKMKITK